MNKTLLILKNEIYALVSRPSFWLSVVGVPAAAFLIYGVVYLISRSQTGESNPQAGLTELIEKFRPPEDTRPQGYVDYSGLIAVTPEGFPAEALAGFGSESAARRALENGEISAYYVITADYIDSGRIRVFTPEYNLIGSAMKAQDLYWLLDYNLAGGDPQFYQIVKDPLGWLERESLSPPEVQARERDRSSEAAFFVPYAVMMLFYMSILGSSGLMLNSISNEKENRALEILMVSATPQQLLLGKIAGLGLAGLFQVVLWSASALGLLRLGGQTFALPETIQLPVSILGWGVVFFILGYLVYASLMAGVGALVPNLREASQVTTIVIIPMMIPLFVISGLIEHPNGALATALSLFPLTSPTTMMLRLAAADVPLWQVVLSAALLAAAALLIIRMTAGLFRAQTLLSGQPFKVKRFFALMLGRK